MKCIVSAFVIITATATLAVADNSAVEAKCLAAIMSETEPITMTCIPALARFANYNTTLGESILDSDINPDKEDKALLYAAFIEGEARIRSARARVQLTKAEIASDKCQNLLDPESFQNTQLAACQSDPVTCFNTMVTLREVRRACAREK